MVNGNLKRRANLTANTEEIITFSGLSNLNIFTTGGTIAYKINRTVSGVNDDTANFISSSNPIAEINTKQSIRELHVISDTATTIQWDSLEL
jgi:L-asparaginase/Glu-tRNA(Gln) amidotransferase subunit D